MAAHLPRRFLALTLSLGLVASACGGAAAPTPTKAPAPAPVATAIPRPAATATPIQAAAPAQPTATPTARLVAPTATPPARPGAEGKITFAISNIGGEPLDAHMEKGGFDRPVTREIYESLGGAGMERKIVGQLAESWEVSPDGLAWTWHLRKGVKFHSGDPFDAQDAKFTLERIIQPKFLHPQGTTLGRLLDRVDTPEQYTVVWRLKRPFMQLLNHELWITHISKRYLEREGDEILNTKPAGTGPFKFVRRMRGEWIELEAFEDHYMTPPTVKTVVFRIIPEPATRVAMLQVGEADIATGVAYSSVPELERIRGIRLLSDIGGRIHIELFDQVAPEASPWKDLRVRQAASLALDRKTMIEKIFYGKGRVQASNFSPITSGHDPTIPEPEYDREKAKRLMAEAGYPNGFDTDFVYHTGQYAPAAEAIVAYLRDIGIRAKLVKLETAAWGARYREKSLRGTGWGGGTGVYYDGGFVSETFLRPGAPWGYITDPKLTELDERAGVTVNLVAREKILQEMDRYIAANLYIIPVVAPDSIIALGPRIKDYTPPPGLQTSQGMAFVRLKE